MKAGDLPLRPRWSAGAGPAFVVLRIAGDVVAVINFMLQMSQSGTAALEFIDESKVAWTVEADAGTATATLFMDGVPVEQISLE